MQRSGQAGQATETPVEPAIHMLSMTVANATRLAKEKLDEAALESPVQAICEPAVEEVEEVVAPPAAPEAPAPVSEPAAETATASATVGYSDLLLSHYQPLCQASEQVRQLRTALLKLAGKNPIRCMITSAQAQEGKSVTSANLAFSFSELSHKRTLLIDADLRRGRVAELFGVRNELGLADILARRCALDDALIRTSRPNLDIVTTGQVDLTTLGELLIGDSADMAIRDLIRGYDFVIFDTPPAASLADASIIGRWVNMALLAVRIYKTPRTQVEQAKETLANAGVNIAGIVALDENAVGKKYSRYSY